MCGSELCAIGETCIATSNTCEAQMSTKAARCKNAEKKCVACEGPCDTDKDCMGGLKCFQRRAKEAVPGCTPGGKGDVSGHGYCYFNGLGINTADNDGLGKLTE